jgi:hypothetical protein
MGPLTSNFLGIAARPSILMCFVHGLLGASASLLLLLGLASLVA